MKCIKSTSDNEIRRVSDTEARQRVNSGRWHYVNKTAWKLYRLATKFDANQQDARS